MPLPTLSTANNNGGFLGDRQVIAENNVQEWRIGYVYPYIVLLSPLYKKQVGLPNSEDPIPLLLG